MNIEIVEAYLIVKKGKRVCWSLHVYIPEYDMDLRGIKVYRRENSWFFQMPYLSNYDHEEKRIVKFPVIGFSEREKSKRLIENIQEKAKIYIEEKLSKEMESIKEK